MADPLDGRRLLAQTRMARWSHSLRVACLRALRHRREDVLRDLRHVDALVVASADSGDVFGMASWSDEVQVEVVPAARGVYGSMSSAAVSGLGGAAPLPTMGFEGQLSDLVGVMDGLGSDTAVALERSLTQGVARGEGIPELSKRVMDVFGTSESRAKMIARTEASKAANAVADQAGRAVHESGVPLMRGWLTSVAPCPACTANALAGLIPFSASFDSGHQSPPAHPQCACVLYFDTAPEPKR